MMTALTETIVLTLATHPFQVALGGVALFYAICEALAALPLKPRGAAARSPFARLLAP